MLIIVWVEILVGGVAIGFIGVSSVVLGWGLDRFVALGGVKGGKGGVYVGKGVVFVHRGGRLTDGSLSLVKVRVTWEERECS